ncbi:uncharacterized protein LOC122380300 [Amphibalanus amphitrite]|uniref:uncharacterized protein LOC122380300 n=1 Tax=Amphibalanus amphitrite TaxID=1232801 RepID=UPI001C915DC2|nr:uncharacterized protein LOC122380300 [Amphibalanus amphitrite]
MAASKSCASFIPMSDGRTRLSKSPPKTQYDHIDEHAALIGLQALSLNLESANRGSEPIKPQKKCLKPLKISTTRKTPEKHVSISPMSATPRSSGSLSGGKFRTSPCRSDSSGFQSLPSPVSAGSHCGSHISDGERLFTNHSNVQVMTSDSAESLSTHGSSTGSVAGGRGARRSRSRQSTPQPRQVTPRSRQDSQSSLAGSLEEYATVFEVQNILRKGELVEGVLRFDRRSHQQAYIRAPVNLDRADGHLKWRNHQ